MGGDRLTPARGGVEIGIDDAVAAGELQLAHGAVAYVEPGLAELRDQAACIGADQAAHAFAILPGHRPPRARTGAFDPAGATGGQQQGKEQGGKRQGREGAHRGFFGHCRCGVNLCGCRDAPACVSGA